MKRLIVNPPLVTPPAFTLLDYVQWVDSSDPHWKAGITYEAICGSTDRTLDYCVVSGSGTTNPTKVATAAKSFRGALPFTVYAEIDCAPVGFWDNAEDNVRRIMARTEHWDVERAFWTGTVGLGVAGTPVMPHLAANAAVVDSVETNITLQTAATVAVTGTLDVVEGLAALEQYLEDCYGAQGLIYVTLPVFETMISQYLLTRNGPRWQTAKGNWVVPGGGFPGTSPAGAAPAAGTAWMYATGALMGYRSNIRDVATMEESFNHLVNTASFIVERTYVLGWDCCHAAVLVSTGGVITGTANAAT